MKTKKVKTKRPRVQRAPQFVTRSFTITAKCESCGSKSFTKSKCDHCGNPR